MNSKNVLLGAVLMASSGLALGQHAGHAVPPSSPSAGSENRTPAKDKEMSPASAGAIGRLSERLELARQSNDPAQMRAALDDIQNSLGELKRYAAETGEPPESRSMGSMGGMQGMDQSKMSGMPGMNPSGTAATGSKKSMPGMAPPPKSPPSGKAKEMDHSQMDMSGKDNSMKGMPGMKAHAEKGQTASAAPAGKETS
ncbi:MAG: hypothetical protein M3R62_12835, partial [Acidobacteriota bacterium]|nr:hypothetical protein [Acidobacteriota bacterium]